jgi:hypothetical protein
MSDAEERKSKAFLKDAYSLESAADTLAFYDRWAEEYDVQLERGLGQQRFFQQVRRARERRRYSYRRGKDEGQPASAESFPRICFNFNSAGVVRANSHAGR